MAKIFATYASKKGSIIIIVTFYHGNILTNQISQMEDDKSLIKHKRDLSTCKWGEYVLAK